jgi:1-acyl-sn-glycerol-3-phosphate acyltransferase
VRYDVDSIENRDPRKVERIVRRLEPWLETFFHPVVRGLEHVPSGPGLYVANHNGGLLFPDAFVLGVTLYRRCGIGDLPYALAHDMACRPLPMNRTLVPLGLVRASRENARKLFAAHKKVLVYPGGDVEALRPFRDRDRIVFDERRGYLRLALEEGVPIIPVVSAGAHSGFVVLSDGRSIAHRLHVDRDLRVKVFPIVLSLPWGLTIGFPPPYVPIPTRIYLEVLPPIRFERSGAAAAADDAYVAECHRRVEATMQAALTRLAHERAADKRARNLPKVERIAEGAPALVRRAIERCAGLVGLVPAADEPATPHRTARTGADGEPEDVPNREPRVPPVS